MSGGVEFAGEWRSGWIVGGWMSWWIVVNGRFVGEWVVC